MMIGCSDLRSWLAPNPLILSHSTRPSMVEVTPVLSVSRVSLLLEETGTDTLLLPSRMSEWMMAGGGLGPMLMVGGPLKVPDLPVRRFGHERGVVLVSRLGRGSA